MLFVVMLGGKHPRAKIEVHDVVFAVADTLQATYPQLRDGWFGSPKGMHIDAWMAVDGVDGWKVELSQMAPPASAHHLYFINLGGYEAKVFGEAHHYLLVVARDKQEAKRKGQQQLLQHWSQSHTDAVMDIDDCLPIDLVDGRYVHLVPGAHQPVIQQNDYITLP